MPERQVETITVVDAGGVVGQRDAIDNQCSGNQFDTGEEPEHQFTVAGGDPVEHGVPGIIRPGNAPGDDGMKIAIACKKFTIRVSTIDALNGEVALSPIDQGLEALAQALLHANLAVRQRASPR